MEINSNGRSYKSVSQFCGWEKPPENMSLCKFFWMFVGVNFIAEPLIVIARIIAFVFFGHRIDEHFRFIPIRRWPKVCGTHVMPIVVLLVAISVGTIGYILYVLVSGTILMFHSGLSNPVTHDALFVYFFIALFAVVFGAHPAIRAISRAEAWQIFAAYLKARKEKFCPIITFVDKK